MSASMMIIGRYIARHVIGGTLMVALLLMALSAFLALVAQFDDFHNNYGMVEAIQFTVLSMPQQVYELFPMSVLLGSLIGLGAMASSNELTVMRASGVSIFQLAGASLVGGLVLALLCLGLGELVAPPAEQHAKQLKASTRLNQVSYIARGGVWARDDDVFLNVRQMITEEKLAGIRIVEMSEDNEVERITEAETAEFIDGRWVLQKLRESRFEGERVEIMRRESQPWQTTLSPDFLRLFVIAPDIMSTVRLLDYIDYLEANGLSTRKYWQVFWTRVITPFSVMVMVLLALPFVFGPLRSVGNGQRVVMGVLVGVAFYVVNLMLGHSGVVFGMNPAVAAILPTAVAALIAAAFLRRVT
ncbi:MAG: LPS export ABC transporter permease LptG [Gammaproteobacteria bacterium]|nr:LPS export ABC transporter permease LptG [Gammaproteobacteria bacterium]